MGRIDPIVSAPYYFERPNKLTSGECDRLSDTDGPSQLVLCLYFLLQRGSCGKNGLTSVKSGRLLHDLSGDLVWMYDISVESFVLFLCVD